VLLRLSPRPLSSHSTRTSPVRRGKFLPQSSRHFPHVSRRCDDKCDDRCSAGTLSNSCKELLWRLRPRVQFGMMQQTPHLPLLLKHPTQPPRLPLPMTMSGTPHAVGPVAA
jgi:hypothetical protein